MHGGFGNDIPLFYLFQILTYRKRSRASSARRWRMPDLPSALGRLLTYGIARFFACPAFEKGNERGGGTTPPGLNGTEKPLFSRNARPYGLKRNAFQTKKALPDAALDACLVHVPTLLPACAAGAEGIAHSWRSTFCFQRHFPADRPPALPKTHFHIKIFIFLPSARPNLATC